MRKAFTLIELLIVIAIIAILALIAVPNFLEAQVRAKVSRVHADQRSLATAIEAYAVDWGRPPMTKNELGRDDCIGWDIAMNDTMRNWVAQAMLTTPVAFISTIPRDPFTDHGSVNNSGVTNHLKNIYSLHGYVCSELGTNDTLIRGMGYNWCVNSPGPSRNHSYTHRTIIIGDEEDCAYDSSNGTISLGWILRTNKGVFTIPGS